MGPFYYELRVLEFFGKKVDKHIVVLSILDLLLAAALRSGALLAIGLFLLFVGLGMYLISSDE